MNYSNFIKYYEITKKYHELLLANTYNKEAWYFDQVVNVSQLKKDMTYQEIIEYIVNTDKTLEETYTKLQDLYKLAKSSHHGNA